MFDYDKLIKEIDSLPKGNVYKKRIKNNDYYYHQFSNNGIKVTKIVRYEDIKKLIDDLELRKKKENKLKEILKNTNKNLKLSKSSKEYTGYVMAGNKIVAEFNNGKLIKLDKKRSPLVIKNTKRLEPFLKSRCIDQTRNNSRILKKVLNIKVNNDELVSLSTYSISVSDNYWFKPKHSKLKYKDILEYNDIFFNLSLKGETSIFFNKLILTPDLTTNGSYEKGWKKINNNWYLYKSGNKEEIFSELFYANLFELLKLPTAHYEYDNGYIKTKNFASKYNFEPMSAIAGENNSIEFVYEKLKRINPIIAKEYIRLCLYDVVLNNIDRHNENSGILRDKKSGNIISLAPNYDDNLCLISRDKKLNLSIDEGFLQFFIKLINKNLEIKHVLKETKFPILDEQIIDKCFEKIKMDYKVNKEDIKKFILNRYHHLLKVINK